MPVKIYTSHVTVDIWYYPNEHMSFKATSATNRWFNDVNMVTVNPSNITRIIY